MPNSLEHNLTENLKKLIIMYNEKYSEELSSVVNSEQNIDFRDILIFSKYTNFLNVFCNNLKQLIQVKYQNSTTQTLPEELVEENFLINSTGMYFPQIQNFLLKSVKGINKFDEKSIYQEVCEATLKQSHECERNIKSTLLLKSQMKDDEIEI